MITAKIDVSKMDKTKLFKGAKGTYLDIVLIPTPQSEFGDYMICQSVSKEERLAGKKGAILGNAKKLHKQGQSQRNSRQDGLNESAQAAEQDFNGNDVPY